MKVGIISNKKTEDLVELQKAFQSIQIQAPFLNIERIALFTKGNKTELIAHGADISAYEGIYLKAGPEFTQFAEPFLDVLASKGIYCQMNPESFYITSNIPYEYAVLNSKGVKTSKTTIVSDVSLIESAIEKFSYPLIFKTFVGMEKTQSLVVENERSLKSLAKSIKTGVDALTIQEYLEGDLYYIAVVGKEVFAMKNKWNKEKFEHEKRFVSATAREDDAALALKAADIVGCEVATVKIINGRVLVVRPQVDFPLFQKITGKEVALAVAKHFKEVLER